MKIINNIGRLRNKLIENNWHMTAFAFRYNRILYDVLFENNDDIENRKNLYASVILTFIDINEPERKYIIEANQVRLFFDPKEFRMFFKIEYSPNLGDIFKQFFLYFLDHVPKDVPTQLNDRQNNAIDRCLAARGGHNPDAIYCYDARRLGKRNGVQMHRSIFISNLTERKKPELYKHLKNDITITFYYSPNPYDELDWVTILEKFTKREQQNLAP